MKATGMGSTMLTNGACANKAGEQPCDVGGGSPGGIACVPLFHVLAAVVVVTVVVSGCGVVVVVVVVRLLHEEQMRACGTVVGHLESRGWPVSTQGKGPWLRLSCNLR